MWQIDPADDDGLAAWHAVLHAVDQDLWPDRTGFTLRDIRAFARHRGRVPPLRPARGAASPEGRSSGSA